jgi:hypothetical protein
MELNVHLTPTDGEPLEDPTRYRHIVGSLIYLGVTRPDISYFVHILSQFVSTPTQIHYSHLLHVLRYLCGTISRHLFYSRSSSLQLQAYCDATWASDSSDRRCRHIVGSLIYLGVTRPNLSYSVHILSQFVSALTQIHYSHLLRVLRYLRGTMSHHLFFPRSSSLQLQAYCDAT